MKKSKLFPPSAKPHGHGITIGTPRLYDLFAPLFFFGTRRRSYRALLAAARVRPGDRVLDIGCGPGYFARMLARAVGPAGSVVGLDAAPEMIDYARERAHRLANCSFECASAEALPFPDGSFDLVTSSLFMHHLPEELRHVAVQEMRRVLRPTGGLLLADFAMPKSGGWHVLAAVTGHAGGQMIKRVPPLEPLVEAAGFVDLASGDVPPWLHYVRAAQPQA